MEYSQLQRVCTNNAVEDILIIKIDFHGTKLPTKGRKNNYTLYGLR